MDIKKEEFLREYKLEEEYLIEQNIDWHIIEQIAKDYISYKTSYETQANLIANILRGHPKVHSVKMRTKHEKHLIEKLIRKTSDRRKKYGEDFHFTLENYKDEITDLVGIRVIHIFKEDWEEIHNFITKMWKIIEIVANIREGDNTRRFKELNIEVCSRLSGYRSVHYLIESYPTTEKVITEIQVRTIFEEGYGEIDHQLRYSLDNIPEILEQNLMLLNRIAGSSDEMASLINSLSQSFSKIEEHNYKMNLLQKEIKSNNTLTEEEKIKFLNIID